MTLVLSRFGQLRAQFRVLWTDINEELTEFKVCLLSLERKHFSVKKRWSQKYVVSIASGVEVLQRIRFNKLLTDIK